jgi:hypothetical protein
MKIRKVSADVLEPSKRQTSRSLSPREQRRLALESKLEQVMRRAADDPEAAFRLELEEGEKAPTVRQAFRRVRDRLGTDEVNLFARDESLIVAKRPQTRGRRPKNQS